MTTEISKIVLPDGTSYDIKDAVARAAIGSISGALKYLGATTTSLSDGSTANPIIIGSKSVTAVAGDVVIYGNLEFVWSDTDSKWHEFGSTGSLKALAFKDNATGIKSATASAPAFTGTSGSITVE